MIVLLKIKIAVICVILSYCACVTAQEKTWNYNEQENWRGSCNIGINQSPINIGRNLLIQTNNIPALNFQNWNQAVVTTVKNDGHSVLIEIPGSIKPTISGGGLSGNYKFQNLHIHWPSEHTVEGQRFDLEAHFVFYSSRFSNFTLATTDKNGVAVISILYNQNVMRGPNIFDSLASAAQRISRRVNTQTTTGSIIFQELLPSNPSLFYHYSGSLTTPDCNEVVSWYILKDTGKINFKQYQALTTIYGSDNQLLTFTNRRIQALNRRQVYLKLY